MGDELTVVAPPPPPPPPPPPTFLAPGFRFHPTDEELVRYYLWRKICGKSFRFQAVSEIDVYKSEPWELAGLSPLNSRDQEWYFFSPVDKKYGNGSRLNRATGKGYWKATGKDRVVRHKDKKVGLKKTLVFHSGRAPGGNRTNWVMHEYRIVDQELERAQVSQEAFVLCRIFEKSGLGPPIGNRYAPFVEEEWEDDAALFVPGGEAEDEMTNGDGTRNYNVQTDTRAIPFICKRERSEDQDLNSEPKRARSEDHDLNSEPKGAISEDHDLNSESKREGSEDHDLNSEPKRGGSEDHGLNSELELEVFSLFNKSSKQSDPNSSNANGSEGSTTTSQDPRTTNCSSALVEFPLLDSIAAKEASPLTTVPSFDASTLEKSVPPGYLKFITNLENEIVNVSMEKETLKIEVMRAHVMINILHSQIEHMTEENSKLRRGG